MNDSIKQIQALCNIGQVEKATILLSAVEKLENNRDKLVPEEVKRIKAEHEALKNELEYLKKSAKRRKVQINGSPEQDDVNMNAVVKTENASSMVHRISTGLNLDLKSVFSNNGVSEYFSFLVGDLGFV